MSWQTVKASELIVKRGGSVNPSTFPDETFELFSIPAFDAGVPEISIGSEIGSSKSCIQPNDVLLSKIVPHIRRCWVVTDKKDYRQIGSGEWIIFRDERFYPKFLKYFLTSDGFHHQFMNTVAGVGGSLVRARPTFVEKIEIPLPPLDEQKRIAAILDKADAIRQKRKQAIVLADEFLRSVFLEMFGDPVTNPKGWALGSMADFGGFKNGLNYSRDENGVELSYIGVGDFKSHSKLERIENLSKIQLNENPDDGYLLKDNDILFVRSNGNKALVGRCLTVHPGEHKVTFSGFCIRYRVQKIEELNPTFLNYCMRMPSMKNAMLKGGQGANIQNINQKTLTGLSLPIPPIEVQKDFESLVSRYQLFIERALDGANNDNALFSALSQKAFSGQL